MHSVFLVEDEILIREGIKNLIAWEEQGFIFCGEAADGELAWPMIQKEKPDVVITDIKMPFMDGLELSKLIKAELPQTTVIILSGYDDFEYARKAIKIGVDQYLLKPISKDQLLETLHELKLKKDEEKEKSQYEAQFANEVKEYLTSSRRAFFDALISEQYSLAQLFDRAKTMNLELSASCYNIVLFLLEKDSMTSQNIALLAELQDQIDLQIGSQEDVLMFSAEGDVNIFLIMGNEEQIEQRTNDCLAMLEKICAPFEGRVRWTMVAGETVARLSGVAQCYRNARKALFSMTENENNEGSGLKSDRYQIDFDPNEMDASKLDPQWINKFLYNGVMEDVDGFIQDYFSNVNPEGVKSVLFLQYVLLNMRFAVNAFLQQMNINNLTEEKKTASELEGALDSLDASKDYAANLLREALTLRDQRTQNKYDEMLLTVTDYMKENYADADMGLKKVAEIAKITSTHFSAVFSQEMGQTFVEYLTAIRMEKAKELLRSTAQSSSEIAALVGYNDPHYFSFLFKKVNGCSPREYRKRIV